MNKPRKIGSTDTWILAVVILGAFSLTAGAASRILRSDAHEVRVAFEVPDVDVTFEPASGLHQLSAAHLHSGLPAGAPDLPVWSCLVGMPEGTRPRIVVHRRQSESLLGLSIPARAAPPERDDPSLSVDGYPQTGRAEIEAVQAAAPDPAIYGRDAYYPAEPVIVNGRGTIRDLDFARIEVRPFQYNPVRKTLQIDRTLEFSVLFDEQPGKDGGVSRSREVEPAAPPAAAPERPRAKTRASTRTEFAERRLDLRAAGMINLSEARTFRARRSAPSGRTSLGPGVPPGVSEAIKIAVSKDGIYRVLPTEVEACGVTLAGKDPRYFRIYNQEREIAILVRGEDDGVFSGSDRIIFYGRKNTGPFTDTNVYWLVLDDIGQGPGRRMTRVTDVPEGVGDYLVTDRRYVPVHVERQELMWVQDPNIPGRDVWYYTKRLLAYSGNVDREEEWTLELGFTIPHMETPLPGERCRLTGRVSSVYLGANIDPQGRAEFSINDTVVGSVSWTLVSRTDRTEQMLDFRFPADLLHEGTNILKVQLPPDPASDKVRYLYTDYFDVTYPDRLTAENNRLSFFGTALGNVLYSAGGFTSGALEIFQVVDPDAPTAIEGFLTAAVGPGMPVSVFVPVSGSRGQDEEIILCPVAGEAVPDAVMLDAPSDLRNPANRARYLVITHGDFLEPVQALADYREAHDGYEVFIADIQDVYDEFSAGNADPQAVKDFLSYAASEWFVPPVFVLIVGDASFDYKDFYGYQRPGYETTYYVPGMPYYMKDSPLTRATSDVLFGQVQGPDMLPDLLIGRIPVRSAEAMWAMVDKIIAYEAADPGETWTGRHVFLGDDDLLKIGLCDPPGHADVFFDNEVITPYLSGLDSSGIRRIYVDTYPGGAEVRTDLFAELNAGAAVMAYYGHSGSIVLGTHCGEGNGPAYMTNLDTALLGNTGAYPFGVATACHVGDFEYVRYHFSPFNTLITASLAEALFLLPDTGFIGWIAGTAEVPTIDGKWTIEGLFYALADPRATCLPPFLDPGETNTAGALLYASQARIYEKVGDGDPTSDPPGQGGAWDTVNTTVLIGDPALKIQARTH